MKNLKNDTKNSIKKLRVKIYKKYSLLSYFLSIQLCKNTERSKQKKADKTIIFSYLLFRASCKYLKPFILCLSNASLFPSQQETMANFYFHQTDTEPHADQQKKHKFNLISVRKRKKVEKKKNKIFRKRT